ncbi:MAG: hypothetical protein ABI578_06350 [Chloroflexota bacterium]
MTAETRRGSGGILIALDVLVAQRADPPTVLDDAPVALRRIGWIGRPIVLVPRRVAGRDLPQDAPDRDAWVRATLGRGAYAVVQFDDESGEVGSGDVRADEVERWHALRDARLATWLVSDRPKDVEPARRAGLKVILIGPSDPQPRVLRPDYQARDLRDAVGHLLAVDVFADKTPASSSG